MDNVEQPVEQETADEPALSTQDIVDNGLRDTSLHQTAAKLEAALEHWQQLCDKTEEELKKKVNAIERLQAEETKLDNELAALRVEIQMVEEGNTGLEHEDHAENQTILNMEQEAASLTLRNFEGEESAAREIEKIEQEVREAEEDCEQLLANYQSMEKAQAVAKMEQERGQLEESQSTRDDSVMEVNESPEEPDVPEEIPIEEEAAAAVLPAQNNFTEGYGDMDIAEPEPPADLPTTQASGSSTSELRFSMNRDSPAPDFFTSTLFGGSKRTSNQPGRFMMFGTPSPVPSENSNDGQPAGAFGGFGGFSSFGGGFGGFGGDPGATAAVKSRPAEKKETPGFGGGFGGFGDGASSAAKTRPTGFGDGASGAAKPRPTEKKNDGGRKMMF